MRSVAEQTEASFRSFTVEPRWQGRLRLVASWITVGELQAIQQATEQEAEGLVVLRDDQAFRLLGAGAAPYWPETLAEARAMLAQMSDEREAVDGQLEQARQALRKAAEELSRASFAMKSLVAHDQRATSALGDVVATFLPDDKGWARSVSVTTEDLGGWQGAAQPWEGA